MPERTFRLEAGSSPEGLRLTISDDPSGETLASFRLTAQQAWDMFRGGSIREIEGKQTNHLDRIGKTMVNDTVEVPREVTDGLDFRDREGRLVAGAHWAEEQDPSWDSYEPRPTNRGTIRVVMRKWVEQ